MMLGQQLTAVPQQNNIECCVIT